MALKDLLKRTMTTVSVDEEPVDPIIEQRRKEKFSTPMIYSDELEESVEKIEKVVKQTPVTPTQTTAPVTTPSRKTTPARPVRPKYDSGYQMTEVISPIYGRKEEPKTNKDKAVQPKKKVVSKPIEDQIVPIISPIYGTGKVVEEKEEDKVVEQAPKRTRRQQTIKKEPETVTEDLRNIVNIIQEEENQLKLVEKRTGEFQFDFSKMKSEEPSLIDEIDDAMTLDELMSLYEKKFREEDE